MPVISVCLLPESVSQEMLKATREIIKETVAGIEELEIGPESITVRYPEDKLKEDQGEEIIIYAGSLFVKERRTIEIRRLVARVICEVIKNLFPLTKKVECFTGSFDPEGEGFYCIEG